MSWNCTWLSGRSICSPRTSYRSCLQGFYFEHSPRPVRGCTPANTKTHHGTPAHFTLIVCDALADFYHERWISWWRLVPWTARSSDLNPLEFYLWGHLKQLVYASDINNAETLHKRVMGASETIWHCVGVQRWLFGHIFIWTFYLVFVWGTRPQCL